MITLRTLWQVVDGNIFPRALLFALRHGQSGGYRVTDIEALIPTPGAGAPDTEQASVQELDALPLVARAFRQSIDVLGQRQEFWERPLSGELGQCVVGRVRGRLQRVMAPQRVKLKEG